VIAGRRELLKKFVEIETDSFIPVQSRSNVKPCTASFMLQWNTLNIVRKIQRVLFRSTSKSRPNNIRGGKCPSVRTSVRPSVHKKVSSISMKFGIQVEVDE